MATSKQSALDCLLSPTSYVKLSSAGGRDYEVTLFDLEGTYYDTLAILSNSQDDVIRGMAGLGTERWQVFRATVGDPDTFDMLQVYVDNNSPITFCNNRATFTGASGELCDVLSYQPHERYTAQNPVYSIFCKCSIGSQNVQVGTIYYENEEFFMNVLMESTLSSPAKVVVLIMAYQLVLKLCQFISRDSPPPSAQPMHTTSPLARPAKIIRKDLMTSPGTSRQGQTPPSIPPPSIPPPIPMKLKTPPADCDSTKKAKAERQFAGSKAATPPEAFKLPLPPLSWRQDAGKCPHSTVFSCEDNDGSNTF